MTPLDYRNTNWLAVRAHLAGRRQVVYEALRNHGPCTTRELAQRSGLDILTVRPRVTELVQLDFATCLNLEAPGREGIYRAEKEAFALAAFLARQAEAKGKQLPLRLGA